MPVFILSSNTYVFIYVNQIFFSYMHGEYFLPVGVSLFHFFDGVFQITEVFNFGKYLFITYSFVVNIFVHSLRTLC